MDHDELLQRGRSAFAAGDFSTALAHASTLVQGGSNAPEALVLLVNAATHTGALEEAIAGLERLLARFPDNLQFRRMYSTALNNRGARRRDEPDAARQDYEHALALWPQNVQAAYNLGRFQHASGSMEAGLRTLRQAHALAPDDEEISAALSECELDAARQLAENGDVSAARGAFAHAAARGGRGTRAPSLRACIAERLALPGVPDSLEELARRRQEYADGLERLVEEFHPARLAACAPGLNQLVWSNFLLAYQGGDDRALQERYGAWLCGAAQVLGGGQPPPPARSRGRRVGLLSSFFRNSTVGAYFSSWIGALTRAGFETVVFQLGPLHDEGTAVMAAQATRMVRLVGPLDDSARVVREAGLDLLIFPELGMDARVFALAALRLAPIQAMAWGHPVTSGLPTVDAYLGCAAMEPSGGAADYRERFIGLPGLGTDYPLPAAPAAATREALGLPSGRIYLVPQAAFKIHPDNDAVYAAIAAGDPSATLVFFDNERPGMTLRLRARLERALRTAGADPDRQVRFLPMCGRERYLAINRACDLMVDTLHWSGGNTTLDALAAGLPVVTTPGRFMRGRQSAAMLARLGLSESLVVEDAAALAGRAIALASDPAECARLRGLIAERRGALSNGTEALRVLVAAVEELLAGNRADP